MMFQAFKLELGNDLLCIHSDDELFVCGDDEDLSLGVSACDINCAANCVLSSVDLNAHVLEAGSDLSAHLGRVLAEAGCEDDSVYAAESSSIGADVLLNAVSEDIQSQLSSLVAFCSSIEIVESWLQHQLYSHPKPLV